MSWSLLLLVIMGPFSSLQDAVSLVRMEDEPEAAARKLTETAFTRGSSDNITCIVVRFLHGRMEVTPLSVTQDQCVPCGGSQDGC